MPRAEGMGLGTRSGDRVGFQRGRMMLPAGCNGTAQNIAYAPAGGLAGLRRMGKRRMPPHILRGGKVAAALPVGGGAFFAEGRVQYHSLHRGSRSLPSAESMVLGACSGDRVGFQRGRMMLPAGCNAATKNTASATPREAYPVFGLCRVPRAWFWARVPGTGLGSSGAE